MEDQKPLELLEAGKPAGTPRPAAPPGLKSRGPPRETGRDRGYITPAGPPKR